MKKILFFAFISFLITSCLSPERDQWTPPFDGTGYVPVYLTKEDVSKIASEAPTDLVDPGKIYLLEPYIFVNEKGRGIHVIDNTDPENPKNIRFLSIPGNVDMAAKGHWLYADNYRDLLTFDISDPVEIRLVKRIENAIPVQDYPPHTGIYFECADPAEGVVIAWEKKQMKSKPKCWR